MQSQLTFPVVFSLGFFMMMATCSLMSRMKLSATPACVCRTVQQMWMLGKETSNSSYTPKYLIVLLKMRLIVISPPPYVYLDGYCNVFRFQPFDVSALDRRKISKSSEPIATTDTSGSPNTNTLFILRILLIKQHRLTMIRKMT